MADRRYEDAYADGSAAHLRQYVRDIPDFPTPGVVFKDITPLLAEPKAFSGAVDGLAERWGGSNIDKVLGVEARGFIFAAPVAYTVLALPLT